MTWIKKKSNLVVVSVTMITLLAWLSQAKTVKERKNFHEYIFQNILLQDTTVQDTTKNRPYEPSRRPNFRPNDRVGDPFSNRSTNTPLQLPPPSNINVNVELDDSLRYFNIYENMGDLDYRNPSMMTFEEYSKFQQQNAIRNYWRSKAAGLDGESVVTSRRIIPKIYISPMFDRIFGGNYVDIRPNGNITMKFSGRFNRNYNPTIPIRQQRIGDFDFDQNITLNLIGKVGEKLKLTFNWD
ncbi:MAG: hypothetical protein LPK19_15590, partial [Hymenobacteraceae bacterium]|nr:hypothetical protein [Hymenobacteraceae bacterium]MDX5397662.1 hypothetical protein [Hymenobacteraceae bacterium]MDX5513739.1 hypothetical protein [Hymenobacteraceae bacterium]